MRLMVKFVLTCLLFAVPVLAQPLDDHARLLQISRAVILEENRLTTTDERRAPTLRPLHAAYADVVWERLPEIETERAERTLRGVRYAGSTTEFFDEQVEIDGNVATVRFTEATRIALRVAGATDAPEATEYEREHTFVFDRSSGDWALTEHRRASEFPFADAPVNNDGADAEQAEEPSSILERGRVQTQAAAMTKLNRTATVNYALKYWGSGPTDNRGYNTAYRTFTNDCTNFISQSVAAGGWTAVTGWYQSDDAWWYISSPMLFAPGQSYTWAGAQNWSKFISRRGRGYTVSSIGELALGDILQIDFQNDGHMDHSMVVTSKDSRGKIYLTYHTSNYKNREFGEIDSSVKKSYPKVKYWRWKLNDKFY